MFWKRQRSGCSADRLGAGAGAAFDPVAPERDVVDALRSFASRSAQPAPRSDLPRFRTPASDRGAGAGTAFDLARNRLRESFTPSHPVNSPEMLAGRKDLLDGIIRALEDQLMHVVLFGDRGMGKTSLLNMVTRLAEEARYIVRYVSCGEHSSFDAVMRDAFTAIPLLYHRDYPPTAPEVEAGRSFADLLPDGPLSVSIVGDLFAKVADTRILLLVDEFDRTAPQGFRRPVAELVKTLSDRSARAQLVIAGVAANLTELIEYIPSIRRNVLGIKVPALPDKAVDQLIASGERISGLSFNASARKFVIVAAHGSPYLAGLLCQHAGLIALDNMSMAVARPDIVQAVSRALQELEVRVSPAGRHRAAAAIGSFDRTSLGLIARLALHKGGILEHRELAELRGLGAGPVEPAIRHLTQKFGLLREIPGHPVPAYEFTDEVLPVFLWLSLVDSWLRAAPASGEGSAPVVKAEAGRWPTV